VSVRVICAVRVTRNKRESSSYSATWNGQHIVGRVWAQGDESSGIGDCADLVYQLQVREAIHVHFSAEHYHYSVPPKLHSEYWVAVCGVQGGCVG
jgi:predicted metal-dependent hydrolase